jgi:hypothetical protein
MSDQVDLSRAIATLVTKLLTFGVGDTVREVAAVSPDLLVGALVRKWSSVPSAVTRFAKAAAKTVLDYAYSRHDEKTLSATESAVADFVDLLGKSQLTIDGILQAGADVNVLANDLISKYPTDPRPSERRAHVRTQLVRIFLSELLPFVTSSDEFRRQYMICSLQRLVRLDRSIEDLKQRLKCIETLLTASPRKGGRRAS